MTANFRYTLEDYRHAFRAHFSRGASLYHRWMLKGCLIVGSLMLLLGLFLAITIPGHLTVVLPLVAVGGAWLWIGLGGSYLRYAKVQFSKNPSLREEQRMEANEEGLTFDYGIGRSEANWKVYTRYIESADSFLIYRSPHQFTMIPKRVLEPEQVNELRELLQRKLTAKPVEVATS